MHLLILPGNSPNNKSWADAINKNLRDLFSSTRVATYKHWDTGKPTITIPDELDRLSGIDDAGLVIFAKSAGVALALKAINTGLLSPEKCIFVGTPLNWARKENIAIDKLLEGYETPTLYIQATQDPAAPFAELAMLLKSIGVANATLKEFAANDHEYADIPAIRSLVEDFVKQ